MVKLLLQNFFDKVGKLSSAVSKWWIFASDVKFSVK